MGLSIGSIDSNIVALIPTVPNSIETADSTTFTGYSETQKTIHECIYWILRIISFGCWKFDPFIKISWQDKVVYVLPDQIKESYNFLRVRLPDGSISQNTLSMFISVEPPQALLPISTAPSSSPSSSSSSQMSVPTPLSTPTSDVSEEPLKQTASSNSSQKEVEMTDEQAEGHASDYFFSQRNMRNSLASYRNEAFEACVDMFAGMPSKVQDYILATLVIDGVLPDRLKKHYNENPTERPSNLQLGWNYNGVPKAFKLYIERLSPKRQAVFRAHFGAIDLENCSDEQAQKMSTFFIKGQLSIEPTSIPPLTSPTDSSSSSAASSSSESSQSSAAESTSSTVKPEDLVEAIIYDKNLDEYEDYSMFFDFHINTPFKSYTFIEKLKFLHTLLSHKERVPILRLLGVEAVAHIVTKIIDTTNLDESDPYKLDLIELGRYTKPGALIHGYVRAAAYRILIKKDPSIRDSAATMECFQADKWQPYSTSSKK